MNKSNFSESILFVFFLFSRNALIAAYYLFDFYFLFEFDFIMKQIQKYL